MKHLVFATLVMMTFSLSTSVSALEPDKLMGQGLYEQNGGNSCMFCHGISGEGGNVAAAAKLAEPKTWKTYAALGGDAEYKKDPKAFVEKMGKAIASLIQNGAIRHNASYKEEGFNWDKIKKFDAQMMGISGAASMAWIKKYKNRGMTPEIASKGVWLYLVELDKQGVLKL